MLKDKDPEILQREEKKMKGHQKKMKKEIKNNHDLAASAVEISAASATKILVASTTEILRERGARG